MDCPGDYAPQRVIGRGQFSVVYRARDVSAGRDVALKKIRIFDMMEPKQRADCLKEIDLLKKLDHPNVIKYLDSFLDGEELIIVLELAEWGDLARMIHNFRRHLKLIPERSVWRYFTQVAAGLDHMHSKRIMHRDIKPANVFVTGDGTVKLGDLGLSRSFSARTMAAHSLVGTPYYMSPERLHEMGYTFSSDIWSLGCLLYELAALQSPFYGERMNLYTLTKKIELAKYPPLPGDAYTRQLVNLITACLQPDPRDRPQIAHIYCTAKTMLAQMS